MTQTQIERLILEVLNDFKPHMTPETTLANNTMAAAPKRITRADFDAALSSLIKKDPAQVTRIPGDDGARYKISPAGEARLLE